MDKIFLRELRVETIIGFWEWERRIKQMVTIDLEIGTDARVAASIGQIVIREFAAPWVKVSVAKPGAIPAAREVGIVIERTPADYA